MIDIKWIKENPIKYDEQMGKRGFFLTERDNKYSSAYLIQLDNRIRKNISRICTYNAENNAINKKIGILIKRNDFLTKKEILSLKSRAQKITKETLDVKKILEKDSQNLVSILKNIPNTFLENIPDDNYKVIKTVKGYLPKEKTKIKSHYELFPEKISSSLAVKIAGPRFMLLYDEIALLERVLGQYMMDVHTNEHGYKEISLPFLVKETAMYNTGQLPKFEKEQYCTDDKMWLIPTGEVPLVNIFADVFIPNFPQDLCALTPCFRKEAGAGGKHFRGLLRLHQFHKVELVSFVRNEEEGLEKLEIIRKNAETILVNLKIPFRTILLPANDIGFSSKITYDIEVFIPSLEKYVEVSSCSYCGDFQARRANIKFKQGKFKRYVHTLNGSGVAVGRLLAALIECYQDEEGNVVIPEVLRKYMKKDVIKKEK